MGLPLKRHMQGFNLFILNNALSISSHIQGKVEQLPGLRLHTNRVVAAEILDHKWGMTASMDGKIIIFELDNGNVVQEVRCTRGFHGNKRMFVSFFIHMSSYIPFIINRFGHQIHFSQ